MSDLRTRLLLALHGIPIEEPILDVIRGIVRDQLATLRTETLSFDAAMRLMSDGPADELERIERLKAQLGLRATESPDVSRSVASDGSASPVRSPGAGIVIRDLWREGERRALLVTMPPGSQWPGLDYHVPGPEEVFVISGDIDDGPAQYTAGTFIHYPAGSSHSPSTTNGCSLFVFYPEG